MMSDMTDIDKAAESPANTLCKSCGLCCTGHLFIWTKLRSAELNSAEALGLTVLRSVPSQRGFNQPCPLWQGECTIYASRHYPRFCRTYKCKLLKKVLDGNTSLGRGLTVIKEAKDLIHQVEALLPHSQNPNFRERLVARLEELSAQDEGAMEFRQKARALVALYEDVFGVDDLIETSAET
jgi:uncharacterized protein